MIYAEVSRWLDLGRVAYIVTTQSRPILLVREVLGHCLTGIHTEEDAVGFTATFVVEAVVAWYPSVGLHH